MSDISLHNTLSIILLKMGFHERLVSLRKERQLTQQALADLSGLNVVQIRRWESGAFQPSLEALVKLTRGLRTSADALLFGEGEREPDSELRLQFEAITRLDPDEKSAIRSVLEGMLLKHEARRWQTTKG